VDANLAQILSARAERDGAALALDAEGTRISYSALERMAAQAAAALAATGVRAGDRVALRLPNGVAFVAAYFGALRSGAIVVPLNPLLSQREVDERLAVSEPLLVVEEPLETTAGAVPERTQRAASDPAVILFTSGTSGTPKGAVLTHGGLRAAAENACSALELGPADVVLGAAPFSHVLGQSVGILATFLGGGAIAVIERFDAPVTLETMCRTGTTVFLGVPTMCILLLAEAREGGPLPPLRVAHVGGAPLPAEVADEFEGVFGARVAEGYGLTELSGIATTFGPGQARKPGAVGAPVGETELRIVDLDGRVCEQGEIGEVQFRGPSVVPGYWRDERASAEALSPDGWLATGDIGRLDEDGDLFLVDRKKELIIRGGYNVYPREVEEALHAHPGVREVAVVGVPHATLGEEVAAVVVPRPGAELDPDELRAFARERLAAYKYPRVIALVDELPHTPTGKILKRAIDREELTRRLRELG
jgi:long-chain acyl-CoA synthetase